MLSNFLQKPVGILTVLTAAVGGPYAAFETDLGNSLRRTLTQINAPANPGSNDPANDSPNEASGAANPYNLASHSNSALSQAISQNGNVSQSSGWPSGPQSFGTAPIYSSANNDNGSWVQGQPVSTIYGPATVQPSQTGTMPHTISQAVPSYYASNPALPPPTMEVRSGPSSAIPGGTDKLWDYTLGTPSLNQIQQHQPTQIGGGAVSDLREVLRFDITPGWLPQRFARVTTVTAEVQMDGLRVPLITGTQSHDIAGSLTYYFDSVQSLKRIQLHGMTGDPSPLANLMVQFYQLRPEQSLGGQLFTARWNNRITSLLQVTPAPVIYAGAEHSKYILFLELNQPSHQYGMSRDAMNVLTTAQLTQRW